MENTILLADDEAGIRKVLGISLADSGYEVLTAENGEEALKIFRDVNPPIVLTDIKMPGMDGIDLLRKIKLENPDTEVIMITGHGDLELAIKSLKYEATDFVTKPINDDVLEIALRRAHERITMRQKLREYTENLEEMVSKQSARLVEVERLAAVGQAVEGLSAAMRDIAVDFNSGIQYFNEMPCFVAIHNRDLKIVATNQLYKERLGDKIGCNSWEIYSRNQDNQPECPAAVTFKTAKGQRSQEAIEYPDGSRFSVMVHTAPIHNSSGDIELVLEISADISEVERLQEKLRTTQQSYQQLFDIVPCYITVQDRLFRITASNNLFKEDFGENIHSHCFQVYKHRGEPCEDCPVAKTFGDGESHQSEMIVTSKSGEQYNVLINTAPIYNIAGEIEQVMEMSTNITQIRQLQDRLSSLGLMLGSVSHGVKGVLTGLEGGLYLLDSGLEKSDSDQVQDGLEIVKLMAERIRNLVLDVLYYAKERALEWRHVPAIALAEDVSAVFEQKIQTHQIEFSKEFDASTGEFEADPNAVRAALINIIENAIEACVQDLSTQSSKILFRVTQEKDFIVFAIQDNGIGMDAETRDNMFNLFYSSKKQTGTGLGLFITKQIVQQHGGAIEVDSTPGQGSCLRVRMPKILSRDIKAVSPGIKTETT